MHLRVSLIVVVALASLFTACKKPVAPAPAPPTAPDTGSAAPSAAVVPTVAYADLGYRSDGTFTFKAADTGEKIPFSGVAEEKFGDGTLAKRYEFKDGRFHGETREFYEDGSPKTLTTFVDGQRHGPNTYWNPDGSVMKKQVYEHDAVIESTDPTDREEIERHLREKSETK